VKNVISAKRYRHSITVASSSSTIMLMAARPPAKKNDQSVPGPIECTKPSEAHWSMINGKRITSVSHLAAPFFILVISLMYTTNIFSPPVFNPFAAKKMGEEQQQFSSFFMLMKVNGWS
jgi:hypothetical protein